MCLVHSTRCRPGLTHAGNITFQLLQCPSGQESGPTVGWGMPIYLFCRSFAHTLALPSSKNEEDAFLTATQS